jgi:arsenate reductase (thioredoxin)
MTLQHPIHVLFLCTHNSARSLMAEAILNTLGGEQFKAFSAGSAVSDDQHPHPLALEELERAGLSHEGLHSKSWDVFAKEDAPHMDLIITVCDDAANEVCPVWPGHPATAHWGYPDPSRAGDETQQREAFKRTLMLMHERLEHFVSLPSTGIDRLVLAQRAMELAQP